jgi:hypothetical protein
VDIDQTKLYAAEYVVDSLCGSTGRRFEGLGPMARYLIQMTAQYADDNAKLISKETTRTPDAFMAMEKRVSEEFVMSILGMGDVKRSATEAAAELVQQVWTAYIVWAQEARINPGKAETARVRG